MDRTFGRPLININKELFEMMCKIPKTILSLDEMVKILSTATEPVSMSTLKRFCKQEYGVTFERFRKQQTADIKFKLAAKQLDIALKGNPMMLAFLGKQMLGQADKLKVGADGDTPHKAVVILPSNGRELIHEPISTEPIVERIEHKPDIEVTKQNHNQ